MLDIHTHILPKMDDGSCSVKQSFAMLRAEALDDVDCVVFTPHFYAQNETPETFLKRREAALRQLTEAKDVSKSIPKMILGAEVAYFAGISRAEGIEELCIDGTNSMLIEMPFCRWNRSVLDELDFLMENRGIRPIIAHIERYMFYQSFGTVRRLCEKGILIQANTSFFTSWNTAWMAMWMLKKNRIHFLGSDCHNMKKRPPDMGEALFRIELRLGRRALKYLRHVERILLGGG